MVKLPKNLKIIQSPQLTRLILLVSQGYNYGQKISKKIGNKPSPVSRQLKLLEKNNLLKAKRERLLNKKIYSVDYQGISVKFVQYIQLLLESSKKDIQALTRKDYFEKALTTMQNLWDNLPPTEKFVEDGLGNKIYISARFHYELLDKKFFDKVTAEKSEVLNLIQKRIKYVFDRLIIIKDQLDISSISIYYIFEVLKKIFDKMSADYKLMTSPELNKDVKDFLLCCRTTNNDVLQGVLLGYFDRLIREYEEVRDKEVK